MNPNIRGRIIAARHKHLLALEREYRQLLKAHYNAPLIEVDEPYQRGWVRSLHLRDDITRRKDAPTLKAILHQINVYQYCRNKNFTQRNGQTRKIEPIGHHSKRFTHQEWQRLSWADTYKKYFEYQLVSESKRAGEIRWNHKYVFKFEYYFVSKIEKNIVTHQRASLPEVQARIQEIRNYMDTHLGWKTLNHLLGHKNWVASYYQRHSRKNARTLTLDILDALNHQSD